MPRVYKVCEEFTLRTFVDFLHPLCATTIFLSIVSWHSRVATAKSGIICVRVYHEGGQLRAQTIDPCAGCQKLGILQSNVCFHFADGKSKYFGSNVRGLASALQRAVSEGCLGSWSLQNVTVEVVMQSSRKPVFKHFIMLALEQRGSPFLGPRFFQKVIRAAQVWSFSHLVASELIGKVKGTANRIFYVPSRAYINDHDWNRTCPRILPNEVWRANIYHHGKFLSCIGQGLEHSSMPVWVTDQKLDGTNETKTYESGWCSDVLGTPQILQFGAIDKGQGQLRVQMCDTLSSYFPKVACVSRVFGRVLQYLICEAEIIFVEHYYKEAALETHRIDPLVQAGKMVLAVKSADDELDAEYKGVVLISERNSMVDTIFKLMHKPVQIREFSANARALFQRKALDGRKYLCASLQNLQADLKKASRWSNK